MEYMHVEKIRREAMERFDRNIGHLQEVPLSLAERYFHEYTGELDFAYHMSIITMKEYDKLHAKLYRAYKDRTDLIECNGIVGHLDDVEVFLPFEEVPAEEQETFEIDDLPFPEVMQTEESGEPEEQPADEKQEYVESQYKYWLEVCGKPQGCDEEHLNYLHGYFTMAGEIGAVSMHRAEDMVHELTHVFDMVQESEIENEILESEKFFFNAFGVGPKGELCVHVSSQRSYYEWKEKSKKYRIEINQDGKVEAMIKKWNKGLKAYEKVYTRTYACIDELVSVI